MRKPLIMAMALALVLGACGSVRESRLNPLNWFGRSTDRAATVVTADVPSDGRVTVTQIQTMAVEPRPGGAIIRATGIPPTQGYWDAELVREPSDNNDELRLRFVVAPPPAPRPAGTPLTREVTVATFVSDFGLAGIRRITVAGVQNERTTARR